MTIPSDWIDAAELITPGFEVAGDPYLGVTGDFDQMGISCGALQWNIGKGSLQPMVISVGQAVVTREMPVFGKEMWSACNTTIIKGLKIVRSWQNGTKLKAKPAAELKALMDCPEMRKEQRSRIENVAGRAFKKAEAWAKERDSTSPTKRLFCWFFDIVTQNGGLEGITPKIVADFVKLNQPDKVDDLICDFLKNKKGTSGHIKDANKNGKLWRNAAGGEKLELICMSYLRAGTADKKWQHVVLNRKGTIAMGVGWVNSSKKDFSKFGL